MIKQDLINELKASGALRTPKIIAAFEQVDRADFVLPEYKANAYENNPLPIGQEQTISQPYTVAFMLELLQPKKGEKVLEVGTGSGWQTALLAFLTRPEGRVYSIERIIELKLLAEKNLQKYNLMNVRTFLADGSFALPQFSPFDKIISAASAKQIPPAWKAQLKIGGRIVAPVGQSVLVLDKTGCGEFKITEHKGFAFVPLVSD